jgi:uncharacterized protein (TIGR03437 family)
MATTLSISFKRAARRSIEGLLLPALLLAGIEAAKAQQSILGNNLIVNGDAEAGPAGTSATDIVAGIPGWTRTGKANVLPYGLTGYVLLTNPAPPDHGFNYFACNSGSSTLTQVIDVSSVASTISGGKVRYTASAYLGRVSGINEPTAQVVVAFQNAGGQTFTTVTLGPAGLTALGMSLQQQIGIVPSGTMRIEVTLTLNTTSGGAPAADSLSLVLGTSPGSVLGTNLVVNGGAEAGPGAPYTSTTAYVPGWSTAGGASVAPYGGTGWIPTSAAGPADRGVNLFCGPGSSYQDIDVSAAAASIDSGQVKYEVSAWLGGSANATYQQSPTLTYTFFDWSGTQLAPTAQLGPHGHSGASLVETSDSGQLPSGTRRVHIALTFGVNAYAADDISFTLAGPSAPPVITPGGIVSAGAFGGFTSIAPGTWIEIYGTNLSSSTRSWAGSDFSGGVAPTSLDGVSVSVGGKAAFLDYISSGQINALVPSDTPTGIVPVAVANANGTSDQYWLIVNPTEPGLLAPPTFTVNGKQYVVALFSDGQTFALPQGALAGVASRPAKPGETLTIYGVGFGPVSGGFTAGSIVTAQNSLMTALQFLFGTTPAVLSYDGLAPSYTGLYQFNVVVPAVSPNGAMPLSFNLGGTKGTQTLYIAVGN